MMASAGAGVRAAMLAARAAEREQTRFYRALAVRAEEANDAETAERLNGLLADEQHHFSRLTARLLELGERLTDSREPAREAPVLAAWEQAALAREKMEADRYRELLTMQLDAPTRALIEEILEVEQRHARELGGKWMRA